MNEPPPQPTPLQPARPTRLHRLLPPRTLTLRSAVTWIALCFVVSIVIGWASCVVLLVGLRFVDPPTTAVQIERHIEATLDHTPYQKRSAFEPITTIGTSLQHAVIAAEDARFYEHHGFDWHAMQLAAEGDMEGNRLRGGSTLTQQLVKNLFLGTNRSLVRKAAEATLVPPAEIILGKQRILELYLNVVEWGPGVYGAQSASLFWYKLPASKVTREQAASLASILPAPRKRRPSHMNRYSAIILERMSQMGW